MWATPALGAPGDYTMLWQAVSSDGHAIDGEIAFSWAPESDVDAERGIVDAAGLRSGHVADPCRDGERDPRAE